MLECLKRGGIEVMMHTREEGVAKAEAEGVDLLATSSGQVYGWVENGKIHLTEDGLDAETPIHEYTHLWVEAMCINSPKTWSKIVKILKESELWDDFANKPAYKQKNWKKSESSKIYKNEFTKKLPSQACRIAPMRNRPRGVFIRVQ